MLAHVREHQIRPHLGDGIELGQTAGVVGGGQDLAVGRYGACAVRLLTRAKPRHDVAGLEETLALARPILAGLGFGGERAASIAAEDPDALGAALRALEPGEPCPRPSGFLPVGDKREIMRLALRELHLAAPTPVDVIALPQARPSARLRSTPRAAPAASPACRRARPGVATIPSGRCCASRGCLRAVRLVCGDLPEQVITLRPQLDWRRNRDCAAPERRAVPHIAASLSASQHISASRPSLPTSTGCLKIRANVSTSSRCAKTVASSPSPKMGLDPHSASPRPKVRTTEDYLREREETASRMARSWNACTAPSTLPARSRTPDGVPVILLHGWPYDPRT